MAQMAHFSCDTVCDSAVFRMTAHDIYEHPQNSRAISNSIAGRMGEHPSEKDQRTGELHAKENQGVDKCERRTHQILTRCDFDFTIWGYLQSGFNC